MMSKAPNQSSYLYGSYRSYSQGSEKDKERELAILLYYDNGKWVALPEILIQEYDYWR